MKASKIAYIAVSAAAGLYLGRDLVRSKTPALGCALGDIESCVNASRDAMNENRHKEAVPFAQRACDKNNIMGCNNLAVLYAHGENGAKKDIEKALALYKRACDSGVALSCRNLGNHYFRALDVPEDLEKAAIYFDKACAGDNGDGCNDKGLLLQKLKIKPEERLRSFKKACDLNEEYGCRNWAIELIVQEAPLAERKKGHDLMLAGCKEGRPRSCSVLGKYLIDGLGGQRDVAAGLRHLENSCQQDTGDACRWLGAEYASGKHVKEDLTKAASLLQKSCDLTEGETICKLAKDLKDELEAKKRSLPP